MTVTTTKHARCSGVSRSGTGVLFVRVTSIPGVLLLDYPRIDTDQDDLTEAPDAARARNHPVAIPDHV